MTTIHPFTKSVRQSFLIAVLPMFAVVSAAVPAPASSPAADVLAHSTASAPSVGTGVFVDRVGDVKPAKLDIEKVRVINTASALKVRVYFPGVAQTYDFPTGNVTVFVDTDKAVDGPEWAHQMEFWSEYRFQPVTDWQPQPSPDWGHAPEGRCVEYASVSSDRLSRLRFFEYRVKKASGCFDVHGPVRVAASTLNTGDLKPYVEYPSPRADHLGFRHKWTAWVKEG